MGILHMDALYKISRYPPDKCPDLLFQRRNSVPHRLLPNNQRLNPNLRRLLQLPNFPNSRIRRISRPELSNPRRLPRALSVPARAGITARAGFEDGGFACGGVGGWDVEDEAETA